MPRQLPRAIIRFSVLTFLLAATPSLCYALEGIEFVTPERAKELGLEVRYNAAGPDAVRVVLQFETKGELKDYSRVALEIHVGEKLVASSTLREEKGEPGHVVVSFAADRARLDQFTLKVVTQVSPRTRTGHILRMKEFVDPTKIR